jgi:hypothetical protein
VTTDESTFRQTVRSLIARGTYPDHTAIRRLLGLPSWQRRSGLKGPQTRWRMEEVEQAGYDWESSKRSRRLIRKGS